MNRPPLPPALFLMGPTASGKTDLAAALVDRLPCDIISVDSALVYREMDIGTAKPGPELLARAPHRLIDLIDPAESYSAARFRDDALREARAILAAGRIPLFVGGTGLYFRALERGLSPLPEANAALRQEIEAEAATQGWAALHQQLAAVDPEAAQRIHPHDPQRLSRALEVFRLTGRPLSELQRHPPPELPFRPIKLAVAPTDRHWLWERIALRFDQMLELGLVAEVEGLYHRGDLGPELPSIRCVGYRQVWAYLEGEWDFATMRERGIVATRQLSKRQYTWLRSEEEVKWFDSQAAHLIDRVLKSATGAAIN